MNKLRLFIVEDQALLLSALTTLLGQEPDFEIVGTAADGEQAKKALAGVAPHIVLHRIFAKSAQSRSRRLLAQR